MSEEIKNKETEQADLVLCNLVAKGKTVAEAKAIIAEKQKATEAPAEEEKAPPKPSAAEQKETIAAEIVALGGTPPESGSVAKFQEALDALKATEGDGML